MTLGNGQYLGEKGGKNAGTTYQDATGAPVENDSPLGYSVGTITITLLNITMMIGAGIYSTRTYAVAAHFEDDLLSPHNFFDLDWYGIYWRQFCLLDFRFSGELRCRCWKAIGVKAYTNDSGST